MRWIVLLCVFLLAGCASYSGRIAEPRYLLESGQYDLAIEKLKKYAEEKDKDELLYRMDLGIAYHNAGRYEEAVATFLIADHLAEIKDYTSITQEAGSVLLNEDVKPYKGENFEKILINVYLAIDFTLLKKWDEALVECRKVNHKLDMMISQGGLPYEHNAFAKYMAAMLFEARKEYNDSFVDYRTVLKWIKEYPYLPTPLLRVADKLKAMEEFNEFKQKFPNVNSYKIAKNEGEVVLILEQGKSPVKVPSPAWHLVPSFQRRGYQSAYVWLRDASSQRRVQSYSLFSVEETAIKELDQKYAGVVAKKIAGVAAKEAAALGVEKATDSKLMGALTSIFLHATDHADLRSWASLPAQFHLARMTLPAGKHDILVDLVSNSGNETKAVKQWSQVEVKPGQTLFLNYRTPD